ncbi:unnamed protein product [Macrosiphum euphorbiae]|uniref:Uncharacterized protein n=1 Tax=Macrosiphum euphorbiae TaxID=13131 RepID=A0AAV0X6V2_9HEMI|nr:unnamed protein product [Macrosiphum euphorbiae]
MYCSISPTQTSKKRKLSPKYPKHFNDLTVEHFSTSNRAKIHLAFAKQKYMAARKKLKKVQHQNRTLAEKLKCINISKQNKRILKMLVQNNCQLTQVIHFVLTA